MKILEQILQSNSFKKFRVFLENGKLTHAYLIVSENEQSIFEFSKAISMLIECEKKCACRNCVSCKKILNGFHPDILIYPKGKSFVVADSESIIENVQIRPFEAEYKIIIINRIDIATVQAQNKILKTIEEAPNNVVFILNAINVNAVLPTIKSRSQIFRVENFKNDNLLEDENYQFLINLIKEMNTSKKIIDFSSKFAEKTSFKNRLDMLGEIFSKILISKTNQTNDIYDNIGNDFEIGAIGEIFTLISNAKRQFEANVNTNLITDNLLFKILEVKYLWNKNK